MKILLDNVESVVNVNEYDSFQVLLWDIERSIEVQGRIITSLKVDGMNLDNLLHFSLEEIGVLEVSSKSPVMLLEETLIELNFYIERFFTGIEGITASFRDGKKSEGIDELVEGIYGLEWIFQILKKAEELLSFDNEALEQIYTDAEDVMIKLTNSIDDRSYDRITILLEFDLYILLNTIKEFIPSLLKSIDNQLNPKSFVN